MHLICPKNFAQPKVVGITANPREIENNMLMQNFKGGGGQIGCILGNVEVAYGH